MPRSVRIQYADATYHVLSRGNRKETIFEDDGDRHTFLRTLAETCERTGIVVHGYVLMPNHYHLLLETPEPNLVDGMRWLQGTYTARHRARHGTVGHLLQGRYKAIPVAVRTGDYFRTVSDYIHLNPIRAALPGVTPATLAKFPWSSAADFCERAVLPPWLNRTRVFGVLDLPDESHGSRKRYRAYLTRRAAESLSVAGGEAVADPWEPLRRGWYLGDDVFRQELLETATHAVAGRQRASYANEELSLHDEQAAQKWLSLALQTAKVSADAVRGLKQTDPRKQLAVWAVRTRTKVQNDWIRLHLATSDDSNIRRAVLAYRAPTDSARQTLVQSFLHICRD